MRIARVLHESSPWPLTALERDGALYEVGELDRIFGTIYSPECLVGASDFHTRVIALGGAGLDTLDARLRAGERPSDARILPGTFLWLPPCDTDRSLYVQLDLATAGEPSYRIGNARGLRGSDATVPFPPNEKHPELGLGLAVVLRDDLCAATAEQVERAIVGLTILNEWSGADQEARHPGCGARDTPAQLGPFLVVADDLGAPDRLRAQARVDGHVLLDRGVGVSMAHLTASIAWVSRWLPLRAGDVVGAPCARLPTAYGARVELLIEHLGKLVGRPARGGA